MQALIAQQYNRSITEAAFYAPHATLNPETLEPVGKTASHLGVEGGLKLVRVLQRDAFADEGGWYDLCEVEPTE